MAAQYVVVALKVENIHSGWLSSGKLVAPKVDNIHLLSVSIFFRKLHITLATLDWQLSLSMLHTDSKICAFVNTRPGLAAR